MGGLPQTTRHHEDCGRNSTPCQLWESILEHGKKSVVKGDHRIPAAWLQRTAICCRNRLRPTAQQIHLVGEPRHFAGWQCVRTENDTGSAWLPPQSLQGQTAKAVANITAHTDEELYYP